MVLYCHLLKNRYLAFILFVCYAKHLVLGCLFSTQKLVQVLILEFIYKTFFVYRSNLSGQLFYGNGITLNLLKLTRQVLLKPSARCLFFQSSFWKSFIRELLNISKSKQPNGCFRIRFSLIMFYCYCKQLSNVASDFLCFTSSF